MDSTVNRGNPALGTSAPNAFLKARVFPARLTALPDVAAFIADTALRAGIPTGSCQKLTLLVEELFTNTVEHGHRGECDEPVRVGLEVEPGWIALTYDDTAPAH